jgi:hypothetical protein
MPDQLTVAGDFVPAEGNVRLRQRFDIADAIGGALPLSGP